MASAGKTQQIILEEIITSAMARLKQVSSFQEQSAVEDRVRVSPKKSKQLNIQPYFFIFEQLARKPGQAEFVLGSLLALLNGSYLSISLYSSLDLVLRGFLPNYSNGVIQMVSKLTSPHLAILELFLEIHSTIPMPEESLRLFRSVGYSWLFKVFNLSKKDLDILTVHLYSVVTPEPIQQLPTAAEQQQCLLSYVDLILKQIVAKVECEVQGISHRGKYGFCMMCRNSADYYCKDTGVPVCGIICKKEHLALPAKTSTLGQQQTPAFTRRFEEILLRGLESRRSPSLCADMLIAIYLFSNHQPKCQFHHCKILSSPIIQERVWLLYVSRYTHLVQVFQHIFVGALESNEQFVRQSASNYFLYMAASPRLFELYSSPDYKVQKILMKAIKRLDAEQQFQLIGSIINTVSCNIQPGCGSHSETRDRMLIKAFNNSASFPEHLFEMAYQQSYLEDTARLLLKYEDDIDRTKLAEACALEPKLLAALINEIVVPLREAPLDEVIREVFYFLNFKVADQIYTLLELLNEAYGVREPFDKSTLYQYSYFILMIVTEMLNPTLISSVTFGKVLERISHFHPILATTHESQVKAMFDRISSFPFSQKKRNLLEYYPPLQLSRIPLSFQPQQILIEHWELFYETLHLRRDPVLLYKACLILIDCPSICQHFLLAFLDCAQANKSGELFLRVSEIVLAQPNAVNGVWKVILQFSHGGMECFNLRSLISSSSLLSDDNLPGFARELVGIFAISRYLQAYEELMALNISRLKTMAPCLLPAFIKASGFDQIRILHLLHKTPSLSFYMAVLRSFPVNLFTQHHLVLLFEAETREDDSLWELMAEKCLLLKGENVERRAAALLRRNPIQHQAYILQRALNSDNPEYLVEIKLQKLEPYIQGFSPMLLKRLLLPENALAVVRHFESFSAFQETYDFFCSVMDSLEEDLLKTLLEKCHKLLRNAESFQRLLRSSLIMIFLKTAQQGSPLGWQVLREYISLLKIDQSPVNNSNNSNNSKTYLIRLRAVCVILNFLDTLVKTAVNHSRYIYSSISQTTLALRQLCLSLNSHETYKAQIQKYFPRKPVSLVKMELRAISINIAALSYNKESIQKVSQPLNYLLSIEKQCNKADSLCSRQDFARSNGFAALLAEEVAKAIQKKSSIPRQASKLLMQIMLKGRYDEDRNTFVSWSGDTADRLSKVIDEIFK